MTSVQNRFVNTNAYEYVKYSPVRRGYFRVSIRSCNSPHETKVTLSIMAHMAKLEYTLSFDIDSVGNRQESRKVTFDPVSVADVFFPRGSMSCPTSSL